jgi:hypothetical protein
MTERERFEAWWDSNPERKVFHAREEAWAAWQAALTEWSELVVGDVEVIMALVRDCDAKLGGESGHELRAAVERVVAEKDENMNTACNLGELLRRAEAERDALAVANCPRLCADFCNEYQTQRALEPAERVLESGKWSLADVGVTPMKPAAPDATDEVRRLRKINEFQEQTISNLMARNTALQELVLSYQKDNDIDYLAAGIECGKEDK